jgi:ADP-ribose pyrophosphatase
MTREPAPERIIGTETVFAGKKATVKVHTVELADGRKAIREIIEHPGVAAIVPIDADGNVVLVRQFRLAIGEIVHEIPAGVLASGEEPEAGAQRELQEETGLRAGRITRLGPRFYVSPGISTEWIQVFLAEELSEAPLAPDEDEDIETVRVPLGEVMRMVERGELRDAKSITGVLLAARTLGR